MSRTSKEYCRITILMLLTISLIIPPVASGANGGPGLAAGKAQAALRAKITGAWVDESIDKVLMDLADQAGVDIVKSPEVTGNVTAKVTGVPLAEVLTNVLAAHSFTYVATENMIRVTALPEIALAREELISKVYHITYADANDVAGSLARFVSDKGGVGFNRGTNHIVVTDTEKKLKAVDEFIAELDRQTQQVLVEVKIYEITTSEGFDLGSAFRAARNIEYEQVGAKGATTTTTTVTPGYNIVTEETTPDLTTKTMVGGYNVGTIETRVEEGVYGSQDTIGNDGTVTYNEYVDTYSDGVNRVESSTQTYDPVTTTDTKFGGTSTTTEYIPEVSTTEATTVEPGSTGYYTRKRGKPFVGASFDPQQGGTLSFSLLDDAFDFEFALNVLKKDVESKLLANPRILVLDNETADFGIIQEIPYRELRQVAREDPITYTEFKDVGVQLKVTPHIARDGLIKLHVMPELGVVVNQNAIAVLRGLDNSGRDIYQTVLGAPTVDTRRADTVALVKDGQTIAIGGLRKRETKKSISKVPLLGDIPLLGNLFKSKSESVLVNELVVLITPRIIDSMEPTSTFVSEMGENGIPRVFRGDKEFTKPEAVGMGKARKPKTSNVAEVKPITSFEQAPQVVEQTQTPQNNMLQVAYGYLKMGRYDLAKEALASVIAAQPNNSTAHQYLGYCHLKSGDLDAAIQSYLAAVDLNNADFEAHRGLGVAYMLKARGDGDPDLAARAVEQWQISLDINPDQANGPALRKMIKAYSEQ
ncbi:MAG: tetratricopeptide repeat protein [Sedimentisphaerales bacterium]|nr:tetratricopeptide repeat protein [Sedimentisphaerales bacterium]